MEEFTNFSRRRFLQLIGIGALSMALPSNVFAQNDLAEQLTASSKELGRVCFHYSIVFEEPNERAKIADYLLYDALVPLPKLVTNKDTLDRPKHWWQLGEKRYVDAGLIQSVEYHPNVSKQSIPEGGCLGEITVPYINVHLKPNGNKTNRRYYYSTTHWVRSRVLDERGIAWYELMDDVNMLSYYVRAYAVRLVTKEELEPIAADLPYEAKRIELYLGDQKVIAYENDKQVFEAMVSTGVPEGSTPLGTFMTKRKRPCRRMVNEPDLQNHYDLPGVPWVSYFTDGGVAFHGAYWHSNWGKRMSNGCVNMKSEEAKWMYRWCVPEVPFDQYFYEEPKGTRVDVLL